MIETIHDSIVVPADAWAVVRHRLGLGEDAPLRVGFIAGPGDVVGTFDQWQQGQFETRTPVIAYSLMFYELMDRLRAEAVVLTEVDREPLNPDSRFRFQRIARDRARIGLGYRLESLAFTRRVLAALAEYRPHVVIVSTDAPQLVMSMMPSGVRMILTAHNTYWGMGRKPVSLRARAGHLLPAHGLRRISAAVCTSPECAAQIADLRGSSDHLFSEVPQVLHRHMLVPRSSDAIRHLLYLGRIVPEKGVFDILGAFETLAAHRPQLTLAFAGTGAAEAELAARVARSPVADRISLLGVLSADLVHKRLHQSDLLLCATRSDFLEGLALVVLEAAAQGAPSVLSSVVPAKDLMAGACVEYPADDLAALTEAIRRIVDDPAAFVALRAAVIERRKILLDRSRSWGSLLYRALVA